MALFEELLEEAKPDNTYPPLDVRRTNRSLLAPGGSPLLRIITLTIQ